MNAPPDKMKSDREASIMLIDTEDPAILAHLNPVEAQMLRNIAQRIGMVARERIERADIELPPQSRPVRVEWAAAK